MLDVCVSVRYLTPRVARKWLTFSVSRAVLKAIKESACAPEGNSSSAEKEAHEIAHDTSLKLVIIPVCTYMLN